MNFGDILALYMLSKGSGGGNQYLSSTWQIYQTLLDEDPDVVDILTLDWPWDNIDV